ncbi:MAG: DinB family protein [Aureispira sp.]|nr:DinB family protein [Aureispira sp.]
MDFPKADEYNNYFKTYVSHLPEADPIELLEKTQAYSLRILRQVPLDLSNYKYEANKWSIKEVVLHMIDCEQILSYRALRFARGDFQNALSFDENKYATAANLEKVDWDYLLTSTELLRQFTVHSFKGLTDAEHKLGGSEAFPNTVRATAAIIAGHQLHHTYVLQERYLKQAVEAFKL